MNREDLILYYSRVVWSDKVAPFVFDFVKNHKLRTIYKTDDDIIQIAKIKLIEAIDCYDENKGTKILSHILNHIKWGLLKERSTELGVSSSAITTYMYECIGAEMKVQNIGAISERHNINYDNVLNTHIQSALESEGAFIDKVKRMDIYSDDREDHVVTLELKSELLKLAENDKEKRILELLFEKSIVSKGDKELWSISNYDIRKFKDKIKRSENIKRMYDEYLC